MRQLFLYLLLGMTSCLCIAKQEDDLKLVESSNRFAFTLYDATLKQTNTIYSPFCIYSSLLMAYLGSEKITAKELKGLLKLKIEKKNIPKAYCKWSHNTFAPQLGCGFFIANGMWIEKTTPVLSEYGKVLLKCFQTKPQSVNFHYIPDKIRVNINNWIAERTEFYISDLLDEKDVNEDTKIVLASGAFFEGGWKTGFNTAFTRPFPFHTPKEKIYTDMMHQVGVFPFYETKTFKALALPLSCCYYFVVVLPKNSLVQVKLDLKTYQQILCNLQEKVVDVKLPKFSIYSKYHLKPILSKLNVRNCFTRLANFSAINGRLDLYLSNILHGAFLSINEYGASSSASDVNDISLELTPSETKFYADHPFFFFLCDPKSSSLFFLGKCVEPTRVEK